MRVSGAQSTCPLSEAAESKEPVIRARGCEDKPIDPGKDA